MGDFDSGPDQDFADLAEVAGYLQPIVDETNARMRQLLMLDAGLDPDNPEDVERFEEQSLINFYRESVTIEAAEEFLRLVELNEAWCDNPVAQEFVKGYRHIKGISEHPVLLARLDALAEKIPAHHAAQP